MSESKKPLSLVNYLEELEDPRKARGVRYKQTSNLLIMIIAMMCGYTSLNAIARFAKSHAEDLSEVMPLPRGKTPSSATLHRLSRQINFDQLCNQFNNWMEQYFKAEEISIDGKSIKSTVTSANESAHVRKSSFFFWSKKPINMESRSNRK
jgi:hypothetical protein